MPDNGDWYHLVPDAVMVRRLESRPMLRCVCCGTRYTRGSFTCCAAPHGMASHHWLALSCPDPPHGCGKCAHHCQCANKAARIGEGPLARFGREFLTDIQRFIQRADS